MHVGDKVLHFCAYLALSSPPVIGFRDRRRGIVAGVSMFVLGILMEAGRPILFAGPKQATPARNAG